MTSPFMDLSRPIRPEPNANSSNFVLVVHLSISRGLGLLFLLAVALLAVGDQPARSTRAMTHTTFSYDKDNQTRYSSTLSFPEYPVCPQHTLGLRNP